MAKWVYDETRGCFRKAHLTRPVSHRHAADELNRLQAELTGLKKRIRVAMKYAGDDWDLWGTRAMVVAEILDPDPRADEDDEYKQAAERAMKEGGG